MFDRVVGTFITGGREEARWPPQDGDGVSVRQYQLYRVPTALFMSCVYLL